MQYAKSNIIRAAVTIAITISLFFAFLDIGGYGFFISLAVSLLIFPCVIAALFPKPLVIEFYGKHLQLLTAIVFLALPTIWTVALYGIIGVLLLFEIPILFIQAPPLIAIIIADVYVLAIHRMLTYRVIKEERHPESIMRTIRMTDRISGYVLALLLLSILAIVVSDRFGQTQVVVWFLWILAFVFWSYFFISPISISIANSHKKTRLCLLVAIESLEKQDENAVEIIDLKRSASSLTWLKTGLGTYNNFLSTQPSHPIINNVESYYDAAYSALLAGTKNDKKRMLTSMKEMLNALGADKKKNNFRKFLHALIHMRKNGRIGWNDIVTSIKTESWFERTARFYKSVIVYLVPVLSLVVSLTVWLLD